MYLLLYFLLHNQSPSCSNREDTVHPQWLMDSTDTNWYDKQSKNQHRLKNGAPRKLLGNNSSNQFKNNVHTEWNATEKELLVKEMAKYGRNVHKISQTLKTKTVAEIQALIEAEYGVNLEVSTIGRVKSGGTTSIVQDGVVADSNVGMDSVLSMITTGSPTINVTRMEPYYKNKVFKKKSKNSILRPDALAKPEILISPSEILYEDDLIIGSTESVGSDLDVADMLTMNMEKYKAKAKVERKIGNHRRKVSKNYDKRPRNRSKDLLKSPLGRQRKDSGLSDDSGKSPKMQIVLGSGQALPLSEGEQVIKIEKKKDSEPDSDIEVDIDSDNEVNLKNKAKEPVPKPSSDEAPIAVPLTRFERMPRRQKKIHLDGGGGYTIMHTDSGDLYTVGEEPKRERHPKKQPIHLIQCRVYNADKPAPCVVRAHVSALLAMDWHAHLSRAEVMGLVGGEYDERGADCVDVRLRSYAPAAAAAAATHCDMCPVSQAAAAARLCGRGQAAAAWHHSHPSFAAAPSRVDLRTQRALQRALERPRRPLLGLITSQHWPPGRTASHYRCIRVEEDEPTTGEPVGYQLKVALVPDLDTATLPSFLQELRDILLEHAPAEEFRVDLTVDVCPQANITYLEKFLSSARHHLHSAGYADDDPIVIQLLHGIRDIFR
ncbi:hypothetical protein O3G_MSEX007476 [Manduca sexta]|uniref:MPN domain-containing protein n=1 Tax=Manduca sexta TaxID=7130 RepID=A0A921Z689_MANSE|nr:hypothetical protein O3G_MSEX007476 [Manduca sexta]